MKHDIYEILINNRTMDRWEIYIGATKRGLTNRLKEHKRDIARDNFITALARTYYENDIIIDCDQVKVIKTIHSNKELSIAKTLEIISRMDSNCIINYNLPIEPTAAWIYDLQ